MTTAAKAVVLSRDFVSTRTRVSLQVAVHRLGGLPVMLSPDELQLGRGETLADTARILGGYCDAGADSLRAFVNGKAFDGDPSRVAISAEEIGYLCDAASHWLARPVTPDQVVSSFAGVTTLASRPRRARSVLASLPTMAPFL